MTKAQELQNRIANALPATVREGDISLFRKLDKAGYIVREVQTGARRASQLATVEKNLEKWGVE